MLNLTAARLAGMIAAGAVLAASLPLAPPPAAGAPEAAALIPGWARVTLAGTFVSVAQPAGTVVLAVAGPSRADLFQGGSVWRSLPLSGTHLVRLLPQTVIMDSTARPISPELLRSGDRAAVWGVMRPDGMITALSIVASTSRPAARAAAVPAADTGITGVIAARSGSMLDLVTQTGTRHAVLLTAATQARAAGGTAAVSGITPFDVVHVDGTVNSDGSVVAARVTVEFGAAQSAEVSGPIDAVHSDLGGLLVGGTMVCASVQTYLIRGSARLWIAQLETRRAVTAYGTPIVVDGTPVGLAARVIAVR